MEIAALGRGDGVGSYHGVVVALGPRLSIRVVVLKGMQTTRFRGGSHHIARSMSEGCSTENGVLFLVISQFYVIARLALQLTQSPVCFDYPRFRQVPLHHQRNMGG